MAIAFQTNGTPNGASSTTSFSLSTPSGISVGDLKIAFINGYATGSISQTGGTGTWTKLRELEYDASFGNNISVFYKVHESSDTDPTFSWGFSSYAYGFIARVTGASTTSPIGAIGTDSTGTGNPHTSTALTTTGDNSVVILFDGSIGSTLLTDPSGWTEQFNATWTSIIVSVMYKTIATSGSSSGATSTTGRNSKWGAFQFEILEMGASGSLIFQPPQTPFAHILVR